MKKSQGQIEPGSPAVRRVHLETKQQKQRSSGFKQRPAGFSRPDHQNAGRNRWSLSARLWPAAMLLLLILSTGGSAFLSSRTSAVPLTSETRIASRAERSAIAFADTELDTFNFISRGDSNQGTVASTPRTQTYSVQPSETIPDFSGDLPEAFNRRIMAQLSAGQPDAGASSATTGEPPVIQSDIATAAFQEQTVDINGVTLEKLAPHQFASANQKMYVKVNLARVRSEPISTANAVATVAYADQVTLIGSGSDWSRIRLADGTTGYVLTEFLTTTFIAKPTPTPTPKPTATPTPKPTATPTPKPTTKPTPKPTATPTPTPKPTTTTAPTASPTAAPTTAPVTGGISAADQTRMIELAKSALGVPYVFTGASMSGFDCSGFTRYIYINLFGITLPHSSRDQCLLSGTALSKPFSLDAMKVGDIICFDWSAPSGVCDHVGLYIGGGQYIHASSSAGKVVESTINLSRNPIIAIKRIK